MGRTPGGILAVAAVTALAVACTSNQSANSTVAPTPPVTMSAFTGTWAMGTGTSSPVAPGTCSGVEYTISQRSETSADVTYSGTCAGVSITGSGKGTLAGSVLNWEAAGRATRGSLDCPFELSNGTATPQGDGILVNYGGTVCGVPVQGSQVLRRR